MNRCKNCGRLIGVKEHKCTGTSWNKGMKGVYKLSEEHKKKIALAGIGRKCSEETRKKLTAKNIGNTYNLGKHHSEETRRKISESNKGKVNSPDAIERMRQKLLGRKMSEEQRAMRRGERSSSWKGGISRINARIRCSAEYTAWRAKVYYRDKYTCTKCGRNKKNDKTTKLNADHIKAFSLLMKENNILTTIDAISCENLWNIDNGRTLCVECHKKTDNYGIKAKLSPQSI